MTRAKRTVPASVKPDGAKVFGKKYAPNVKSVNDFEKSKLNTKVSNKK